MKYSSFIYTSLLIFSLAACGGDRSNNTPQSSTQTPTEAQDNVTIIDLTQVGCQFLEVEAKDYQYQTQSADDCNEINAKTLAERQAGFKPLQLEPGKYIFRVTNSNVSYPLGFYLRGSEKGSKLPKVSGGGLKKGVTKDYEVDLTSGEYVFSCPLNPTPDYPVSVS